MAGHPISDGEQFKRVDAGTPYGCIVSMHGGLPYCGCANKCSVITVRDLSAVLLVNDDHRKLEKL